MRYETDPELAVIDLMASSGLTRSLIDRKKAVALVRYGASCGKREQAVAIVLRKRANWLEWLTVTQRRWQRETRRPARARHHDSIEIRERYVRCGG